MIEQFPHGHSNLTYLLRMGELEMVLRRPPFGNQVKSAHDMSREYRVLSRLWKVYPKAPRPYFICEDESVIGAPFYVMEKRSGIVIRKAGANSASAAVMHSLCLALVDNLAALHAVDLEAAGLANLGKPVGYVARQVNGWVDRYAKARTDDAPEMDRVGEWLQTQQPTESGAALIHNDYKFDNLILDAADWTRIVAVLDWEMATVGDPLMDLGATLGYWIEAGDPPDIQQAAMGPTAAAGCLTRRQVVDRYEAATGIQVPDPAYYYCFGLYKIAVIVQQIYARYQRGATSDSRFASMNALVAAMARQAVRTMDRGAI